jgi:hypothetical protein
MTGKKSSSAKKGGARKSAAKSTRKTSTRKQSPMRQINPAIGTNVDGLADQARSAAAPPAALPQRSARKQADTVDVGARMNTPPTSTPPASSAVDEGQKR